MPLYLFMATLPCDALSAFLVFSDRVVYPAYLSAPRHAGLTALEDQEYAGALMWLCVTIAYVIPAAVITIQVLSPQPQFAEKTESTRGQHEDTKTTKTHEEFRALGLASELPEDARP